jgi:hypothetical protein
MKRSTLSTAFYVLLVFLSGGVVGAFAHRLYMLNSVVAGPTTPKPDEWRRGYLDLMRKRLSLDDAQITQLTAILDGTKARFHDVRTKFDKEAREKARPEMKVIQEEQVRQVNQILNETQRSEYQKLRTELDQQRREKNKAKQALPRGD